MLIIVSLSEMRQFRYWNIPIQIIDFSHCFMLCRYIWDTECTRRKGGWGPTGKVMTSHLTLFLVYFSVFFSRYYQQNRGVSE